MSAIHCRLLLRVDLVAFLVVAPYWRVEAIDICHRCYQYDHTSWGLGEEVDGTACGLDCLGPGMESDVICKSLGLGPACRDCGTCIGCQPCADDNLGNTGSTETNTEDYSTEEQSRRLKDILELFLSPTPEMEDAHPFQDQLWFSSDAPTATPTAGPLLQTPTPIPMAEPTVHLTETPTPSTTSPLDTVLGPGATSQTTGRIPAASPTEMPLDVTSTPVPTEAPITALFTWSPIPNAERTMPLNPSKPPTPQLPTHDEDGKNICPQGIPPLDKLVCTPEQQGLFCAYTCECCKESTEVNEDCIPIDSENEDNCMFLDYIDCHNSTWYVAQAELFCGHYQWTSSGQAVSNGHQGEE